MTLGTKKKRSLDIMRHHKFVRLHIWRGQTQWAVCNSVVFVIVHGLRWVRGVYMNDYPRMPVEVPLYQQRPLV